MFGVWRSWLARRVWDAEVEGSSPFTPTILHRPAFFAGLWRIFSVVCQPYEAFLSLEVSSKKKAKYGSPRPRIQPIRRAQGAERSRSISSPSGGLFGFAGLWTDLNR